ncbi:hypothetical protein EVA_03406 [gut metagenome]|uniref:Uncharacterized protein n=1 Tax=gut metagenome TaxID=749906 RepID=J9GLY3_9ZZZZ
MQYVCPVSEVLSYKNKIFKKKSNAMRNSPSQRYSMAVN